MTVTITLPDSGVTISVSGQYFPPLGRSLYSPPEEGDLDIEEAQYQHGDDWQPLDVWLAEQLLNPHWSQLMEEAANVADCPPSAQELRYL